MPLPPHTFVRVFGRVVPIPVVAGATIRIAVLGILGPLAGFWAANLIPTPWVRILVDAALVYVLYRTIRHLNRKIDRYRHTYHDQR